MSDKVLQVTWEQQMNSCTNNCSSECLLSREGKDKTTVSSHDVVEEAWIHIQESKADTIGFYWNPGQQLLTSEQIRTLIIRTCLAEKRAVTLATTLACLESDPLLLGICESLNIRVGINFYQAWLQYGKPKYFLESVKALINLTSNLDMYAICALFTSEFAKACELGIDNIIAYGYDVHLAATGDSIKQNEEFSRIFNKYKSYLGNNLSVDCKVMAVSELISECPFDEIILTADRIVHSSCVYGKENCSLYQK